MSVIVPAERRILALTNYLIDFENVNEDGLNGFFDTDSDSRVFIFYTQKVNKISFGFSEKLLSGFRSELHFCGVKNGKQSLDMQLVSFLGFLIGQESTDDNYIIISRDNDFQTTGAFWNERLRKNKVCQYPTIRSARQGLEARAAGTKTKTITDEFTDTDSISDEITENAASLADDIEQIQKNDMPSADIDYSADDEPEVPDASDETALSISDEFDAPEQLTDNTADAPQTDDCAVQEAVTVTEEEMQEEMTIIAENDNIAEQTAENEPAAADVPAEVQAEPVQPKKRRRRSSSRKKQAPTEDKEQANESIVTENN